MPRENKMLSNNRENVLSEVELENKQEQKPAEIKFTTEELVNFANKPKNYILHRTEKQRIAAESKTELKEREKIEYKPVKILCFGCHGNLDQNAKIVAEQIAEAAAKDQVVFIIVTGDNMYPKGVSSPRDPKFASYFYEKYVNKYPSLHKKCFFVILGNHDHNLRNYIGVEPAKGIEIASNEVAHTYLDQESKFSREKIQYLNNTHIDIETLEKEDYHWVMPSRFYTIYQPESNTDFFFLDSNTFLHDYLQLQIINHSIKNLEQENELAISQMKQLQSTKKIDDISQEYMLEIYEAMLAENKQKLQKLLNQKNDNQAYWFKKSYTLNPSAKKIIIQHHPVYTVGKRAEHSDAKLYLKDDEVAELKTLFHVNKGCELVWLPDWKKTADTFNLPGQCRTAYILTGKNKLFYADKIQGKSVEIPLTEKMFKQLKQNMNLTAVIPTDEKTPQFIKNLTNEEILSIGSITNHIRKKEFNANYNDLIKMAFRKENILQTLDLVIHSHDHATSLFYDSDFDEQGRLLKKSFCQLTVGGGGGEFQDMRQFAEIKKIPVYCGFGSSTITLQKDKIEFAINTAKSLDMNDWHSQGKSWRFSTKSMLPVFDWNRIVNEQERKLYLELRQLVLNGCYDYFNSYEHNKEKHRSFFRMADSYLKLGIGDPEEALNARTIGHIGLARALNVIGIVNNPNPASILTTLKEVYTVLGGSTTLLDSINKKFKGKAFSVKSEQWVTTGILDFIEKYESYLKSSQLTKDKESHLEFKKSAIKSNNFEQVLKHVLEKQRTLRR